MGSSTSLIAVGSSTSLVATTVIVLAVCGVLFAAVRLDVSEMRSAVRELFHGPVVVTDEPVSSDDDTSSSPVNMPALDDLYEFELE